MMEGHLQCLDTHRSFFCAEGCLAPLSTDSTGGKEQNPGRPQHGHELCKGRVSAVCPLKHHNGVPEYIRDLHSHFI